MDWMTALVSGAASLAAGFAGAYWGPWLKTRAEYGDRETILKTKGATAFEQEQGKLDATVSNLDKLVQQLSASTQAVEKIKADIGGDLWLRQTIWTQQRECYFNLLDRASRLQSALNKISRIHEMSPAELLEQLAETNAAPDELDAAFAALRNEFSRSRIFVGKLGQAAMEIFEHAVTDLPDKSGWNDMLVAVMGFTTQVTLAARQELGVSPLPFTPPPARESSARTERG